MEPRVRSQTSTSGGVLSNMIASLYTSFLANVARDVSQHHELATPTAAIPLTLAQALDATHHEQVVCPSLLHQTMPRAGGSHPAVVACLHAHAICALCPQTESLHASGHR
jgi:hypothetical protein